MSDSRDFAALSTGKGKQLLDWFMDNCSDALVRVALRKHLESKGPGSALVSKALSRSFAADT